MFEKNSVRIPTVLRNQEGVITQYLYQDFIIHDTAYDRISDFWRSNKLLTWVDEDSKHIMFDEILYLDDPNTDMFVNLGFPVNQIPWFHSFKCTYECNTQQLQSIVSFVTLNRKSTGLWECWFHKTNELDYTNQITHLNQGTFSRFTQIQNEPNSLYSHGIKHIYQIPDQGDYLTKGMFICTGVRNFKETLFIMKADFCTNTFSAINDDDGNILEILKHGDPGEPDSQGISWASVMNIENKYLRLWYEGYDGTNYRILTAVSYDGLKWYKEGVRIDIGGEFDSVGSSRPFVVYDSVTGKYKLFYTGFDGTLYKILSAISIDGGVTFEKKNQVEYYDSSSLVFKDGVRTYSSDENKRYIQRDGDYDVFRPIFFFEVVTQGLLTVQVKAPANRDPDLRSAIQGYPYKTGILITLNYVTIYDMTGSRPKMWMKFPISITKAIKDSQTFYTQFLNGRLFILRINPHDPSVTVVDFTEDIIYDLNNTQSKKFSKSIMNRDQDGIWIDWDRVLLSGNHIHNIGSMTVDGYTFLGVCTEEGFDLINIEENTKTTFLQKGVSNWEPIWCSMNKYGDVYIVIKDFNNENTQIVAYYAMQNKNSESTFQEYADAIYTMTWGGAPGGVYTFINGTYGVNEIERVKVTNRGSTQDTDSNKIVVMTDGKGITVIDEVQGTEASGVAKIYDTIPTQANHELVGNSDHFISAQIFDDNLYTISDAVEQSDWLNKFDTSVDELIEQFGENIENDENIHNKFGFANNR